MFRGQKYTSVLYYTNKAGDNSDENDTEEVRVYHGLLNSSDILLGKLPKECVKNEVILGDYIPLSESVIFPMSKEMLLQKNKDGYIDQDGYMFKKEDLSAIIENYFLE